MQLRISRLGLYYYQNLWNLNELEQQTKMQACSPFQSIQIIRNDTIPVTLLNGQKKHMGIQNLNKVKQKKYNCTVRKSKSVKVAKFKQNSMFCVGVFNLGSYDKQGSFSVDQSQQIDGQKYLQKISKNRHIAHGHTIYSKSPQSLITKPITEQPLMICKSKDKNFKDINTNQLVNSINKTNSKSVCQFNSRKLHREQKKTQRKQSIKEKNKSVSALIFFQNFDEISGKETNKQRINNNQQIKTYSRVNHYTSFSKNNYRNTNKKIENNDKKQMISKTYMKDTGRSDLLVKKLTKNIKQNININQKYGNRNNPYQVNIPQFTTPPPPKQPHPNEKLKYQDVDHLKVDIVAMYQIKNDVSSKSFKLIEEKKHNESYDYSQHYIVSKGEFYLKDQQYQETKQVNICETSRTIFNYQDQIKSYNGILSHLPIKMSKKKETQVYSQKNNTQKSITQMKIYSNSKLTQIKQDDQNKNSEINRKSDERNYKQNFNIRNQLYNKKLTICSDLLNSRTYGNSNFMVSFAEEGKNGRSDADRGLLYKWRQFVYNVNKVSIPVALFYVDQPIYNQFAMNKKYFIGDCVNIKITRQKSKMTENKQNFRHNRHNNTEIFEQSQRKQHIKRSIINVKFYLIVNFSSDMETSTYSNKIMYFELVLRRMDNLKNNLVQQLIDKLYSSCMSYHLDDFKEYFQRLMELFKIIEEDNGYKLDFHDKLVQKQLRHNEPKKKRVKISVQQSQNSKKQIQPKSSCPLQNIQTGKHLERAIFSHFKFTRYLQKQYTVLKIPSSCSILKDNYHKNRRYSICPSLSSFSNFMRQFRFKVFIKTFDKFFVIQIFYRYQIDLYDTNQHIKIKVRIIHELLNQTANLPIVQIRNQQRETGNKLKENQQKQKQQISPLQISEEWTIEKIRKFQLKYEKKIKLQRLLWQKQKINEQANTQQIKFVNFQPKKQYHYNFLHYLAKVIMDKHIFDITDEQNIDKKLLQKSNQQGKQKIEQKIKVIECQQNFQRYRDKQKKIRNNLIERMNLLNPISRKDETNKSYQKNQGKLGMQSKSQKKRRKNLSISLNQDEDFNQNWAKQDLIKSTIFKKQMCSSKIINNTRKSWMIKSNHNNLNQSPLKTASRMPRHSKKKKEIRTNDEKAIAKKINMKQKMKKKHKSIVPSVYRFFIHKLQKLSNLGQCAQPKDRNSSILTELVCKQPNLSHKTEFKQEIMLTCSTYKLCRKNANTSQFFRLNQLKNVILSRLQVVRIVISMSRSFKTYVIELPLQQFKKNIEQFSHPYQFKKKSNPANINSVLPIQYQIYADRLKLYQTFLYTQYLLKPPSYKIGYRKVVKLCVSMFVIFTIIYSQSMNCAFVKVYFNWLQRCIFFNINTSKFKQQEKQNNSNISQNLLKQHKQIEKIIQKYTKKIKKMLKQQIEEITSRQKMKNIKFYNMLINNKKSDSELNLIQNNFNTLSNSRSNKIKIRQFKPDKSKRKSEEGLLDEDEMLVHQELVFRFFKNSIGKQFLIIFYIIYPQNDNIRNNQCTKQFPKDKNLIQVQIMEQKKFTKFKFPWNFNDCSLKDKNLSPYSENIDSLNKNSIDNKGIFKQILKKQILSPLRMYKVLLQAIMNCICQQKSNKSVNLIRRLKKDLTKKNKTPINFFSILNKNAEEDNFYQIKYVKYLNGKWMHIFQCQEKTKNEKKKYLSQKCKERRLVFISMKGEEKQSCVPEMGFQNLIPLSRYNNSLIKRMTKVLRKDWNK